jgi:hypothetical protein
MNANKREWGDGAPQAQHQKPVVVFYLRSLRDVQDVQVPWSPWMGGNGFICVFF